MTVEDITKPVDESLTLINREKARKAKDFYTTSGVKKLVDELIANAECLLPITKNIHPSSVYKIIQSLPDKDSTYFDVYTRAMGKPRRTAKCADYEEITCGLIIIQTTPEGDIRLHAEGLSVIPQQLWRNDPEALKLALQIAYKNPEVFPLFKYCPR